jgi:hypothetical protein
VESPGAPRLRSRGLLPRSGLAFSLAAERYGGRLRTAGLATRRAVRGQWTASQKSCASQSLRAVCPAANFTAFPLCIAPLLSPTTCTQQTLGSGGSRQKPSRSRFSCAGILPLYHSTRWPEIDPSAPGAIRGVMRIIGSPPPQAARDLVPP